MNEVVCFIFTSIHCQQFPSPGGSCSSRVSSTVLVVAGMTVVTACLLCRQTAAPGYTEVLAHLSMHSTHPTPSPGRLSLLGLPSSRVTHSTGSLHDWSVGSLMDSVYILGPFNDNHQLVTPQTQTRAHTNVHACTLITSYP